MMIIHGLLSLSPVLIFLLLLISLDSYKVVPPLMVLKGLTYGATAALGLFMLYLLQGGRLFFGASFSGRFMSPIVEEIIKNGIMLLLIYRNKAAFIVDSAIIGFSIGSGFAFIENILYLQLQDSLMVCIVRGFGTAVMHGATVAFFAIIIVLYKERENKLNACRVFSALFISIIIHVLYNNIVIDYIFYTVFQMIFLLFSFIIIFQLSESIMQRWMESEFDDELLILQGLKTNQFKHTRKGRYLYSVKNHLPGETAADLLCYVRIYFELSIRLKAVLMLKEAGLPFELSKEDKDKMRELENLEKSIGITGKRILGPILGRGVLFNRFKGQYF